LYYGERNFLLLILKNFPLPVLIRFLPGFSFVKARRAVSSIFSGCFGAYLRGNADSLRLLKTAIIKRRIILESSILTKDEFRLLLRRNWIFDFISIQYKAYEKLL
jgi:hypothetical protein